MILPRPPHTQTRTVCVTTCCTGNCWDVWADKGADGGRLSRATTVTDCRQACVDNDLCTGFDFRVSADMGPTWNWQRRVECYLHGPWSAGNREIYLSGSTFYNYTCRGKQRRIQKMNSDGGQFMGSPSGVQGRAPRS